ncbi:MAG: hypothetical protein M3O36_15460 [Myxococcota bacterium]|nr:hypothetical protein [Myxococcota bacterium]
MLALAHAVAMNVFLSTALFEKVVDGKPETIDIHYRRGWSVVPGRIHAQDLSIRGRDGNVEWILRLDEVEFEVSFAALAQRRFEARHVRGRGISFRARQRLAQPPASLGEVAALPPIEGLPPYAVRPPPEPEPELWSDAAYRLWSARLEDVVANDVREIWIDRFRFEGNARIAGRFHLKPIRRIEIGPIRIDVREGHLRTGGSVILERLAGAAVDLTVRPFDPRTLEGGDLLRYTSLRVAAHPACADLARLPLPMPEAIALTGPADGRDIVLELRGGVLQPGSKLDVALARAVLTRREHRFAAAVTLSGGVTPADGGVEGRGRLDFRAQLNDLDVTRARASSTGGERGDDVILHVPQATFVGDARALSLDGLLGDVHLLADAADGQLPDVRTLSAYIPPGTPLALKGGRGLVAAHLETWRNERRAAGNASVRIDDLSLRLGKLRAQGEASVDVSFGSFPWETSLVEDARLSLRIARGAISSERRPGAPLVRAGRLRLEARAAQVALADPLRALDAVVSLDEGQIVDPDLLSEYLPRGAEMHVIPGRARFALGCQVTLAEHLASGTLEVDSKALAFSFRDFHVQVGLRAKARVRRWRWERGDLALDGATVDLTDVWIHRVGQGSSEWPATRVSAASFASEGQPALSIARLSLGAASGRFSLADPLAAVELTASLVDARVHDSAIVNAFLPAGAPFAIRANEGGFSSDLRVAVHAHVLDGTIAVHAQRMGIGGQSFDIAGNVDVLSRVSSWDFAAHTLAVEDAHVSFSDVVGGFHGAAPGQLDPAHEGAHAAGKTDFRAQRVELWASTPSLDLVAPSRRGIDGRLVIVGAELPDARALQSFMPPKSILGVESGVARVSADVQVSSHQRTARGTLTLDLGHAGIRFNDTHLVGDFAVTARLLGYDPERDLFDVSGSRVAMRDVQVTNASANTLQWRGDAAFEHATLRLVPQPELEGRLAVQAADASPILAMLLGKGLPKMFVGLVRMPQLSASARLTMGARRVALRDLDAHGGDLSIRGVYVLGQEHRAGAFVVGKGPFSLGFRLDDEGVRLRFFGLRSWLRAETGNALRLLDDPAPPAEAVPPRP